MTARLVPLAVERIGEARALVGNAARAHELLERVRLGNRETLAIAAEDDAGLMTGVVVYGEVAGASGAAVLLWTVVRPDARRTGVARALVERAMSEMRTAGARLVVAEVPGAASFGPMLRVLGGCGFRSEGEVADFYRDGVPLLLLSRRFE